MDEATSLTRALQHTRTHTGIVIPVYFPPRSDAGLAQRLLADNVAAQVRLLDDPTALCLSVDGEQHGRACAEALASEYGVDLVVTAQNRGKLGALRAGMERLFTRSERTLLATVDMDGDHFANELPNMVRAALAVGAAEPGAELLALGVRSSKHRPMGFPRGELEELADRVLLDALAFHAARTDAPLRLEWATALEEYPDFHSGFKLLTRRAAEAAFLQQPRLCGASETGYYRHGVEAVITVEALLAGAVLVGVRRSTFNEQPISAFGQLDRARLVADKMIWACRRLEAPPHHVDQWLRNHIPRLLLNTVVPEGKEELRAIHRLVMQGLGMEPGGPDLCWGPMFV